MLWVSHYRKKEFDSNDINLSLDILLSPISVILLTILRFSEKMG